MRWLQGATNAAYPLRYENEEQRRSRPLSALPSGGAHSGENIVIFFHRSFCYAEKIFLRFLTKLAPAKGLLYMENVNRREDRGGQGGGFFNEKRESVALTTVELFSEEKVPHCSTNPAG
jgi:hypothetical protein